MARRNLDEKHDNSNFRINKNLHPFYNEKTEEKNKIEQQEDNNGELSDSEKKLVSNTANNARKNVNELGVDSKANASLEMIANSIMKKILFISIPFLMVLFLLIIVVVIIGDNDDENTGSNIVSGGYFNARCQEVTVKIADKSKNYEIEKFNKELSKTENVVKFEILADEWTQDNGLLTPTLKVKRSKISKKYAGLIRAMFEHA